MLFTSKILIDDPICMYSAHTLLHDAIILNREELFDFLLNQGANPNIEDTHGYTPLLKAASIGRLKMVKALIE